MAINLSLHSPLGGLVKRDIRSNYFYFRRRDNDPVPAYNRLRRRRTEPERKGKNIGVFHVTENR